VGKQKHGSKTPAGTVVVPASSAVVTQPPTTSPAGDKAPAAAATSTMNPAASTPAAQAPVVDPKLPEKPFVIVNQSQTPPVQEAKVETPAVQPPVAEKKPEIKLVSDEEWKQQFDEFEKLAPADMTILITTMRNTVYAPELRNNVLTSVAKLLAPVIASDMAKRWVPFNEALEKELPKFLDDLATKHKVSLTGRTIKVAYPKDYETGKTASPKPSNVPASVKDEGSANGTGRSFAPGYGKATFVSLEGKEASYDSASALAKSLSLQVEGMRDMVDVFSNPTKPHGKGEAKVVDPRKFSVDADKATKRFIVKQLS
jgi:hypothetical protein